MPPISHHRAGDLLRGWRRCVRSSALLEGWAEGRTERGQHTSSQHHRPRKAGGLRVAAPRRRAALVGACVARDDRVRRRRENHWARSGAAL